MHIDIGQVFQIQEYFDSSSRHAHTGRLIGVGELVEQQNSRQIN